MVYRVKISGDVELNQILVFLPCLIDRRLERGIALRRRGRYAILEPVSEAPAFLS
jgi:hypothetical protein